MKVNFGQVYIRPGVSFPFSWRFQVYLARKVTALVKPSAKFIGRYGSDFELMFNVSAKKRIRDNEIRGPGVYKKTKDVEYSIFLPYDVIARSRDVPKSALKFLFKGVYSVLESLEIDTARIEKKQESLIEHI